MYHEKNIDEILNDLNTSLQGISSLEASERIAKYGKNTIVQKKQDSILKIVISELKDPILLLLLLTIMASIFINEYFDALVIFFIVLIDIIMGTYQENKAKKTMNSISKLVNQESKVIRDNQVKIINSNLLTIGDLILIESGDKIPADLRIIDSQNLLVNESVLTGESIGVEKDNNIAMLNNGEIVGQTNMLFSGTSVLRGRAKAIVVRVGMNTELGKIAQTVTETIEERTPLKIRIDKFSKQISILVLLIAIILMILLIFKGLSFNDIFLSVIALSVSAMPEGLPLALTMALTIASNKMAEKNVIVKRLESAESLGSCTIIASDKTGTLTINEQTAKVIILPNGNKYNIAGSGYNEDGEVFGNNIEDAQEIGLLGVINNEAVLTDNKKIGDSIDLAFLVLGKKLKVNMHNIKIIERVPYESENKYSAVFYELDNQVFCTIKGSLEVVRKFCDKINKIDDNINSDCLNKQNQTLAKEGYRVIAIANGKIKKQKSYNLDKIKDLTFMGLVGFIDPVRSDVISSIKSCREAGIKVLMITGDHPLTAFKIANDLQVTNDYNEVTTGDEVEVISNLNKKRFDKFIKTKKIFARVTPIQKLKIVESLKRQGEFVAVTGDGVNDAPALKAANIGIAMGSGTDIAKETADMIIIDDSFTSIKEGIKEGRIAYANIRKIILFLISCGLAEVLFFTLSIIFNLPVPLIAIQLLWINIVTDGIQDFALSFEKGEKDVMIEGPRKASDPLFDYSLIKSIVVSGLSIGIIIFIVWYYLINFTNLDVFVARGYIMTLMVFIQNIHVFNCRSEKNSAFKVPLKSNYLIVIGVIFSIILQIFIIEVPFMAKFLKTSSISYLNLLLLFLIALSILLIIETYKLIERRKYNENSKKYK